MRKINEIIVHCSATPEGRHVTVDTIRAWHKARKWKDIGYHYVIYLDGKIVKGRPVSQTGAHVAGRNTGTIGICYVGGVARDGRTPKDTRTPAQAQAIESLIRDLKAEFPSITQVSGHNQYASKACPSYDASTMYDGIVGGVPLKDWAPPARSNQRYRYLQKLLSMTGQDFGLIDGIEGPRTIAAIKDYQQFMGLSETGKFDSQTVAALRSLEAPVAMAAYDAVIDDADKPMMASTTVQAQSIQWLFGGGAGTVLTIFGERLPVWLFSAIAIVGVGVALFAGWHIMRERNRKAKAARAAKVSMYQ